MSFTDAIKSVFNQYAGFQGRARRSEYWYFVLFNALVAGCLSLLASKVEFFSIISAVYSLAGLVPGLAVAIRRLHDTGRSGWNLLFALIPLVGGILLIVWYCQDSQPGDNQYGAYPKA